MTASSPAVGAVDLGAVADAVAFCPSVLGLASGAGASHLPGRRVRAVRVADGVVEVHVVARWVAFLPDVADEVRAALRPLVGSYPITVYIDDVGGRAAIEPAGREARDQVGADLSPDRGAEDRRAFRTFVKAHHPDAGGDPEVFVAGLRLWQRPAPSRRAPANVVFHRTRRGAARLLVWPTRRRRHRARRLR